MASDKSPLSGSGTQEVYISSVLASQSAANNTSTFNYEIRYYGNGYGSYTGAAGSWSVSGPVSASGSFTIAEADRYDTYTTLKTGSYTKTHASNGTLGSHTISGTINYDAHSSIGHGTATATVPAPADLERVPLAPGKPTFSNVQPTTLTLAWTAASSPTSSVVEYQYDRATNSGFTSGLVTTSAGNALTASVTGLAPSTTYYFRVRARNATGWGAYSASDVIITQTSSPPTIVVAPSPVGTSTTVTFTPPTGVSTVDMYRLRWRLSPSGTISTSLVPGPTYTVSGLTPGAAYQWWASAIIGTYETPDTAIQTVTQPNPSTNPGDFFDGNTTDKPSADYGWTGTANNSTSMVSSPGVLGWDTFVGNGLTAVTHQVVGGFSGASGARALVKTDATAAPSLQIGLAVGSGAVVVPGIAYVGSIYVYPSRDQRMQARLHWYNGSTPLSITDGAQVLCPANTWTRLTTTASIAPTSATNVLIKASDVAGVGFSVWLAGDWILTDAAMVTMTNLYEYFDGGTPDDEFYDYSWVGTANNSTSLRTSLETAPPDPLVDPDCDPIPAPPRPPQIEDACIDDSGIWRRYWAQIPAAEVSDWLTVIPTFIVETSAQPARQLRVRIYPNPFNYPVGTAPVEEWCSEQIVSYIPPMTVLTIDGPLRRVYAEVSGGAAVAADHLLYGTGGIPPTWPELSCGQAYLVSFDVPLEAPEDNIDTDVYLTRRM